MTMALAREENRLAAERKRAEEARKAAEETRRKELEEKLKQKETEKRKRQEEEQGEAEAGPSVPKRAKMVSNIQYTRKNEMLIKLLGRGPSDLGADGSILRPVCRG